MYFNFFVTHTQLWLFSVLSILDMNRIFTLCLICSCLLPCGPNVNEWMNKGVNVWAWKHQVLQSYVKIKFKEAVRTERNAHERITGDWDVKPLPAGGVWRAGTITGRRVECHHVPCVFYTSIINVCSSLFGGLLSIYWVTLRCTVHKAANLYSNKTVKPKGSVCLTSSVCLRVPVWPICALCCRTNYLPITRDPREGAK